MNFQNSFKCIYYNVISNFYIALNLVFPYYHEEILNLQYKSIECIDESVIFENNARKRKRFNLFIENLIQKNHELLEKMRAQEEEDNNIDNYQKVNEENQQDPSIEEPYTSESSEDSDNDKKNN